MFYYVYILKSLKDHNLYTGLTNNLDSRIKEHNQGENQSTKARKPFVLVYYEALPTKEEAIVREKFYKSGRGRELLKKILFKSLT